MKAKVYPVFFITLLLASCTVYKEYPIEIYKPGEANILPSVKTTAVVYRNFKYQSDTLQHYYKNDFLLVKAKNDPENLDSILATVCINELATDLKNNNAFEEVYIFPTNIFERHTGEHLSELPSEIIENVSRASDAELIIVLETFSSFFSTYPQTFDTPTTNEVITVAVWGIYDSAKKVNIERKTMIDTVFWNGLDNEGNYRKGYTPPPRLTALEMASALAGENYAKRFYATWQTVNRMYSVPPLPDFSDAAFYFEEGKWDQSIALWQKYADDSNGKMAINARYNLALAYELKDDLETAQKWLTAALQLASTYKSRNDIKTILIYQKILDARRKELLKLNRNRNENLPQD
jgi:tetratricopeptide (TPR) repeat protein